MHDGPRGRQTNDRVLPPPSAGLSAARRWTGLGLAAVGLPALTAVLVALRASMSLESVLLLYILAVVVVAVVGGVLPAVLAAGASFLLANRFLTPPYGQFVVHNRYDVIALVIFVLVAVTVSVVVDIAARSRVAAARSRIEANLLSRFAAAPVEHSSLTGVLEQVRATFGMTSVALLRSSPEGCERVLGTVGPSMTGRPVISVSAGDGLSLVGEGPEIFAEDRRLLGGLAAAAARSWESQQLAGEAQELAEVDRVRAALLAAVGHDLRTPLAGLKAAVSSLRAPDVEWTAAERGEFLAAIEDSADRLNDLVANLLAMGRLQAGVLSVERRPVALDEVVARSLLETHGRNVIVDVPDDLPLADTDPGLLERVLANLVANAQRFCPADGAVRVQATRAPGSLRLSVIDTGPGIPDGQWDRLFTPVGRLDDRSGHTGAGLGLAIARGFTDAVGAELAPSRTPGGGLTMTVTLPVAVTPPAAGGRDASERLVDRPAGVTGSP